MKSPVSTCGVYSGLRLPRSASAIWVARRPRVLPSASTTYQSRWRLAGSGYKGLHRAKTARTSPTRPGDDSHLARRAPDVLYCRAEQCRIPCGHRSGAEEPKRPMQVSGANRTNPVRSAISFSASPTANSAGDRKRGLAVRGNGIVRPGPAGQDRHSGDDCAAQLLRGHRRGGAPPAAPPTPGGRPPPPGQPRRRARRPRPSAGAVTLLAGRDHAAQVLLLRLPLPPAQLHDRQQPAPERPADRRRQRRRRSRQDLLPRGRRPERRQPGPLGRDDQRRPTGPQRPLQLPDLPPDARPRRPPARRAPRPRSASASPSTATPSRSSAPTNTGCSAGRFGAGRSGHTHQGQDVMAACGTPLVAARGGTRPVLRLPGQPPATTS